MSTMWPPEMVKMCLLPSCLSILATIWPLEIISGAGATGVAVAGVAAAGAGAALVSVTVSIRISWELGRKKYHVMAGGAGAGGVGVCLFSRCGSSSSKHAAFPFRDFAERTRHMVDNNQKRSPLGIDGG